MNKNKTSIITWLSIVFLCILLTLSIGLAATGSITMFTGGPIHATLLLSVGLLTMLLVVLSVVHFICGFLLPEKKINFAMAFLIPVTMITVFPLSSKWERYEHRRWFFEKALSEYQKTVDTIMRDPSVLNDQKRLQLLVGYPIGCSFINCETNSNGQVVILFSGGDHWREGYIYCSGGQWGDTNSFLTNSWYEN
jgi:hypothetical protein